MPVGLLALRFEQLKVFHYCYNILPNPFALMCVIWWERTPMWTMKYNETRYSSA